MSNYALQAGAAGSYPSLQPIAGSLTQGSGISITGTWPNNTITCNITPGSFTYFPYSPTAIATNTYSLSVSSLALGDYAVNTVSPTYFYNDDTVTCISQTFWTAGVPTHYLGPKNSINKFVIQSIYQSYDMEVDCYVRLGTCFLRLTSQGEAIVFDVNVNTNEIQIGIAHGITESAYLPPTSFGNPSGTWAPLYINSNMTGTIPGFTIAGDTTGHYFTFGVAGFDIYCKYNGTEFCRFRDWRHYKEGAMAFKVQALASADFGIRNVAVRNLSTQILYSDPTNSILDMRDLWMRPIATTGSITGGTATLVLSQAPYPAFLVNDWVIVETGGESGAGARGTVGVGGVWPSISYATTAALLAATPASGTLSYARDTGEVYRYFNPGAGLAWYDFSDASIGGGYYTAQAVPKALSARIVSISSDGKTLTLDTNATVTATAANVYLNNEPFLNYALDNRTQGTYQPTNNFLFTPTTVRMPTGSYAVSGKVSFANKTAFTLEGNGIGQTVIFAPNGCDGAFIELDTCTDCLTREYTLTGNTHHTAAGAGYGFGFQYGLAIYIDGLTSSGALNKSALVATPVTNTSPPLAAGYPYGVAIIQGQTCYARDILVNNVWQGAMLIQDSDSCIAERIVNTQDQGWQRYIQWQMFIVTSTFCKTIDCEVVSGSVIPAFSMFQCGHCAHIRPTATNGIMESNTSSDFLYEDPTIYMPHPNYSGGGLPPSIVPQDPLININNNAGTFTYSAYWGGIIRNARMIYGSGVYMGASNDVSPGIVVAATCPNVNVLGGIYVASDTHGGSTYGPVAVFCQNTAANIVDFISIGKPSAGTHTFVIAAPGNGTINNCVGYEADGTTLLTTLSTTNLGTGNAYQTSDPHVLGRVWSSSGTLQVSAG